jgi:hypothetical protein
VGRLNGMVLGRSRFWRLTSLTRHKEAPRLAAKYAISALHWLVSRSGVRCFRTKASVQASEWHAQSSSSSLATFRSCHLASYTLLVANCQPESTRCCQARGSSYRSTGTARVQIRALNKADCTDLASCPRDLFSPAIKQVEQQYCLGRTVSLHIRCHSPHFTSSRSSLPAVCL